LTRVIRTWERRPATDLPQRIAVAELDYAADRHGTSLDVSYEPAVARNRLHLMRSVAEELTKFGPQAPALRSVLVGVRPDRPAPFRSYYPNISPPTFRGAMITSAGAGEAAILADAVTSGRVSRANFSTLRGIDGGSDNCAGLLKQEAAVLRRMLGDSRILLHPGGRDDFRNAPSDTRRGVDLFVPLNAANATLPDIVATKGSDLAWNGGYYVWLEEEFADPYTAAGDHVGLVISGGRVLSPPLYRRSALLMDAPATATAPDVGSGERCDPAIRSLSMEDYAFRLSDGLVGFGARYPAERAERLAARPGGEMFPFALNGEHGDAELKVYTRMGAYRTSGHTASTSPERSGRTRVEFVVTGREIAAVHRGGGTQIPLNGFVLSLRRSDRSEALAASLLDGGEVRVEHWVRGPGGRDVSAGVQVGPRLLAAGQKVDVEADVRRGQEEYVPLDRQGGEQGVIPVVLTLERLVHEARARIAFGIRADGRALIVAAEGCEPRSVVLGADSRGVTLDEMTDALLDLGCREAVALDSGGAAGLYLGTEPLIRASDRNDVALVPSERTIPGAWLARIRDCEL
jgi:Phosphodiester glycosidase